MIFKGLQMFQSFHEDKGTHTATHAWKFLHEVTYMIKGYTSSEGH